MTISQKQIEWMRSYGRICIDAGSEEMILATYGLEPDGPEYAEQGLHEQLRKLIKQYIRQHPHRNLVDNSTPSAGNRTRASAPMKHRRPKTSK